MLMKPTVLQLIPSLGDGGAERSVIEMADFLARKGWRSLTVSAGGPLVALIEDASERHFELPLASKWPLPILRNAFAIARLIEAEQVDIVHVRSRAPAWSAWIACRYLIKRPVHYVSTFHGLYNSKSVLKRWYNRVMLKGPWVIANSQFTRRHIAGVYGYPFERIVVAARGVDTALFDPSLLAPHNRASVRAEFAVPDDALLAIKVARLTGWKGHVELLKALARTPRSIFVLLVGSDARDGAYRAELEALSASLGIADRVRFAGSRRDIPRLIAAADLALSCANKPEAFGRAIVEAAAMGVASIATAHGGSLETVIDGATGYLVRPGDEVALAAALKIAAADRSRLGMMGGAAKDFVLANYTVERCCSAEMSVYRTLLAGQREAITLEEGEPLVRSSSS